MKKAERAQGLSAGVSERLRPSAAYVVFRSVSGLP
jgi:hypothetical protein